MTQRRTDGRKPDLILPLFVSYSDLQRLVGLSRREIQRMVHRGQLPEPRSFGRRKLFDFAAVKVALGIPTQNGG